MRSLRVCGPDGGSRAAREIHIFTTSWGRECRGEVRFVSGRASFRPSPCNLRRHLCPTAHPRKPRIDHPLEAHQEHGHVLLRCILTKGRSLAPCRLQEIDQEVHLRRRDGNARLSARIWAGLGRSSVALAPSEVEIFFHGSRADHAEEPRSHSQGWSAASESGRTRSRACRRRPELGRHLAQGQAKVGRSRSGFGPSRSRPRRTWPNPVQIWPSLAGHEYLRPNSARAWANAVGRTSPDLVEPSRALICRRQQQIGSPNPVFLHWRSVCYTQVKHEVLRRPGAYRLGHAEVEATLQAAISRVV